MQLTMVTSIMAIYFSPYISTRPSEEKETVPSDENQTVSQGNQEARVSALETETRKPSQIFNMEKTTCWLLLALAIIVIAGVVGGAVGGSLAAKKSRATSRVAHTAHTATSAM